MKKEKSAGAVIFTIQTEPHYLLLKHNKTRGNNWAFPKGHTESGETDEQTARREIQEETALQEIQIMPDFKEKITYAFTREQKTIHKEVIFFLAQTKTTKIKISKEHEEYIWLPYAKAYEKLSYRDSKEILTKAHKYILQRKKENIRNEKP